MAGTAMMCEGTEPPSTKPAAGRGGFRLVQDLPFGDPLSVGRPCDVFEFWCGLHDPGRPGGPV